MGRIKNLLCDWFHGGGQIKRDSAGRINWRCNTCGRWSQPVSHAEEAAMIDAAIAGRKQAPQVEEK